MSNSWLVVPRIYLLHLNHSFIHPQHKQFTTSPALLPSSPRNPISCIRLISHNALASPSQHTATPSQHLLRQKTKRRIRKNFVFFFSRKEEEKKGFTVNSQQVIKLSRIDVGWINSPPPMFCGLLSPFVKREDLGGFYGDVRRVG